MVSKKKILQKSNFQPPCLKTRRYRILIGVFKEKDLSSKTYKKFCLSVCSFVCPPIGLSQAQRGQGQVLGGPSQALEGQIQALGGPCQAPGGQSQALKHLNKAQSGLSSAKKGSSQVPEGPSQALGD